MFDFQEWHIPFSMLLNLFVEIFQAIFQASETPASIKFSMFLTYPECKILLLA